MLVSMVKCAAFNCRSGYRPTKQEEEMMKRGETPPCKKHVFTFPQRAEIRAKWVAAIRREDSGWSPDHCGVCELHFKPQDFVVGVAPRTKKERQRLRLKPDAIPSVFNNYPETARPAVVEEHPTCQALLSALWTHEQRVLDNQTNDFCDADNITDLDDLFNKLSNEMLPSGFRPVMMQLPGGDKLMTIRAEEVDEVTGLPIILSNVTIYANLNFVIHANGMQLSLRKVADITAKSGQFSALGEVLNVMARVKSLVADTSDHVAAAANILESLVDQGVEDEVRLVATFAAEQLRLVSKPPQGRRYSSFLMGNAVVWDRTSPKLYRMMHNCALFCLPHPKTLRRLTSALRVQSSLSAATMTYLGMRVAKLEPHERLINLAMDKVYTAQSVKLAGGRVYGKTAGVVTKTLFCMHINSVAGKYEDMVSMLPVPHVTRDDIKTAFSKVLQGLTELGYKVVSVTTDNHLTNQSWHNSLGSDGRHPEFILNPYSADRDHIYTVYDTVHIFKNLFYGLLNHRTLTVPPFTCSENPRQLRVDFSHLTRVYNMERGLPGKLAYKLTDKVLKPSALERVNFGLAASATHESTCKALRHFAEHRPDCKGFVDTAEFLELVRRWFNICNVKSSFMVHRLHDKDHVELRLNCEESERCLKFLGEFGNSMRSWHEAEVPTSAKITKDTCLAVYYTSRGLVGMVRYLLNRHNTVLDYVLLGKVQSDRIESHFGHLRKLAGSNYWASVRQFMENEAVIRARSLIWWSGYSISDLTSVMTTCRHEREVVDTQVANELMEVADQAEHEELDDSIKGALGYIAGYLARSASRGNKCSACADLLVDRQAAPLDVRLEENPSEQVEAIYRSFTELLDRGKLLVPSSTAIDITLNICRIWRGLVKKETSRRKLLECSSPRKVFVEVASVLISENAQLNEASCCEGHSLVEKLIRQMASALFNLFAGVMVSNINSDAHAKRRAGASTRHVARSQSDDKRRKLTGVKKC